ncbi:hypothetical protein [Devosia indica]
MKHSNFYVVFYFICVLVLVFFFFFFGFSFLPICNNSASVYFLRVLANNCCRWTWQGKEECKKEKKKKGKKEKENCRFVSDQRLERETGAEKKKALTRGLGKMI